MGRSSRKHEGIALQQESITATRYDDVGILGQSSSESGAEIHPQGSAESLRPCGRVNVANVLRLLEWQGYRCALTGRRLKPNTASLDHIVPVRCGGKHVIENAQVLHKDVNRSKSTMTNEEFVQLCRKVARYATRSTKEGKQS